VEDKMLCNCIVKNTTFINELVNVFDKETELKYDLKSLIPAFNPKYSGIWQPVFFDKSPITDDKKWIKINTEEDEECDSETPEGLGIRQLVNINNPKLKNWTITGNLELQLDWIIDFSKYGYTCKTYSSGVLFWYRYYDMGRLTNKDLRLFPGIDLYISDGDMALINGKPVVTPNLSGTLNQINSSFISAGFNANTAKYNAAILATGPQIDRITEILSGPDNGIDYERTSLGLLYPQLSGMSNKRYSDIGQNNYIVTKIDLLQKLSTKYGISLIVPESSEATLKSNFLSSTGPNISIDLNTELYLSDKEKPCAYDISYYLNNEIKLKAYQSNEIFTVTIPPEDPEDPDSESTEKKYNINYVKFGDRTIGYHLSEKESGIFNPDISNVKLHGLGGVDFNTSLTRDISCVGSINSTTFDGPYFLQKDSYPSGLDGTPSNIFINVKTHNNSQFKFISGINIEYLRSDSKPECNSFVENKDTCKCFSLMDLHPEASGKQELSNKADLLFVPATSMYYLPSGQYYGGLTQEEVDEYGIILPDHPPPGTPLVKSHSPIFPKEQDCSYTIDGCGSKKISFNIDYPGELVLAYQSPSGHFSLKWDTQEKENEDPYFTNTAGTLCLTKTTQSPSLVYVEVEIPESNPNVQWAISLSGVQTDYTSQATSNGLNISAKKGFFHPNFGWTYNSKYLNKSPIVPNHNGLSYIGKPGARITNYQLYVKYSNTDGPCPGGHGCNRAKFNVYVNDVFLGIANLNNGGGPEDPGKNLNGDRTSILTLPSSVRFKSGKTMDIFIECAYEDGCHGGIAWVQIISNKGEIIYDACIETEKLITLELEESLNNYFYNSYAMYQEEYLPGYNFMYSISGLSDQQKNRINDSSYIGIKTAGNSYYVNNNFNKVKYNLLESMILDNVPFEYINIDHTYGYAYNDFTFVRTPGSDILTISSSSNNDRILNYFDDPDIRQEAITLISNKDYSKKLDVFVTEILSPNQIRINKSPDNDYYLSGYFTKTKNDGQYNQSITIYRPHITYDDRLTIGKWGNMSYGYAGFMAERYNGIDLYRQDKFLNQEWYVSGEGLSNQWYNNSIIRNGITENTSYSWSCPISFVNNYDKTNQTNFYPLSRIFNSFNNNGDRRYQIINYSQDLQIQDETYLDGDKIIAKGTINNINEYIYLGSLTAPLKIIVKLNITDKNAGFLIFNYKGTEIFRGRVEDVNEDDEIVIEFEKNDTLPIYGQLIVEKNPTFCSKTTSTSDIALNAQVLFIEKYRVEVNLTRLELLNESRISYYQHDPNPPLLGQSSTNTIINDPKDILSLGKKYIRSLNKDFNPFLDLHIFEDDDTQKPIISNSGIIYFEDFFQPKSQNYLLNKMEVPYDDDLYWIDLPIQGEWNLLTEKGILLTQNTTYKILKKLEYDCKGDTSKCSEKYPENICEKSYEIKKSDIYDALGLIGSDQDLVQISEVTFPAHCDTISHCCDTEEKCNSEDCEKYTDQTDIDRCNKDREDCLSEREKCLEGEQQAKDDCKKFWKEDSKYDISCKDICPTGSITGVIEIKTLEYYLLKVKNNLNPPLNSIKEIQLTFLPQSDSIDIPCSQLSFPNIGSTFLYNYSCSETKKDCQTIVPKNDSIGSEFIDGTLLELSALKNNNAVLNITPSSVIIENEIRYRENIPHDNIISLPFYEYDPKSTSKYIITHEFNIKSKECVAEGKLFDLSINDLNCEFSLVDNASGLVLKSPCFNDIVLDSKQNKSMTVYKTICSGVFNCDSGGAKACNDDSVNPDDYCRPYYCEEWSCEDATEYLKSINPNYSLVKCEELTLPEDYYMACRQCGDVNCSVSISYSDTLPRECHCPPGSALSGDPGQEFCEYEYKTLQLKGQDTDYSDFTEIVSPCSTEEKTNKGIVSPSCFDEVTSGISPEQWEIWNKSCPSGTVFTYQSSYDQVISINVNGVPTKYHELDFLAAEEGYRICCEFEKINKTNFECSQSCSKSREDCQAEPASCDRALSACSCKCTVAYYNAINTLAGSAKIYYLCNGYCNESDGIDYRYPYAFFCGFGWQFPTQAWFCGDEMCTVASSAAGSSCEPDRCCPDTSCDGYNACSDLEKRMKFKHYSTTIKCQTTEDNWTFPVQDENKCNDMTASSVGTISSSYKILTRKVTSYTKHKKNMFSQKQKLDNMSTVKVFDKEYKLTYKVNEDCDPACKKDEICCEQKCISEDEICCENENKIDININLKFEIYDNVIIGIINDEQYNKIYHIKTSDNFNCPKIIFKSHNDKVYMCDSVQSECLTCFAGAQDV
jgi:hypothetical protein